MYPKGHNPPVCAIAQPAPFTQGGLFSVTANCRLPGAGRWLASAPTEWVVECILAPEGSIGKGRKSVKKRAALLHVLAFSFLDLLFGVPRGRAPWAGPPALSEVAGTFFASFLGVQKGRTNGRSSL